MRCFQSLPLWHLNIWYYPCSFPIGTRDRTDSTSSWDEGTKVSVDLVDISRMSTAASHLTDNCSLFQIFEVIGKFFCTGECFSTGQNVDRLIEVTLTRDIGQC